MRGAGHGTAGTMDGLFVYAEPFAAAGMAVLVFDYRCEALVG